MTSSVRVTAPASTSNLGPGFDALGMALNLRNDVTMHVAGKFRKGGVPMVSVTIEGRGGDSLPHDATNLVARAAQKVFDLAGKTPERLSLHLVNCVPLASGLGSSAAATVAGMVAANLLCGAKLEADELLQLACEMEGHPDNVAPALLGGLTVSVLDEAGKAHVMQPRLRNDLHFIFCVPEKPLSTATARRALPATYSRADAVYSLSRAAMLTALLQGGPKELFRTAMGDRLHQPYRVKLMPGLSEAMAAAEAAGALGSSLSGSGPTILAIADRRADTDAISRAMSAAFRKNHIGSETMVLAASRAGARISGKS